ncbi:probable mitochondrial import inner membrane translocase subunit TIM21 [Cornus florida]|uniref:probable mitochondrial import inner membrane translocase subunit TIM21 n=1 Tax=Cornus florida TaxID=4283 RepID=UPI0028987F16|nr:probable mitochondrial import inner membrane translocase subunit TIM21 [Cornus florida]
MNHIRRTGFSIKNRCSNILKPYNGMCSFMEYKPMKCVSDVGLARFSSTATERAAINDFAKRDVLGARGIPVLFRRRWSGESLMSRQSLFQLSENRAAVNGPCLARSFASKASESSQRNTSETRKDVSTVEDPFDSPTYNIPEKPVTFAEGASYSIVILAGLGVAAAAGYAVFKELIFQPKEYKIFGKALDRVQNDSQVRVRIGSPVKGYGQESRNRAARQRIPNRVWTDEDGVEHVEVNFYIRGPHGAGKVYAEMFKDKVDNQWKFTYLIVEIKSPSPAQLMLESYVPA